MRARLRPSRRRRRRQLGRPTRADRPDLCPEWWTGEEVTTDPDEPALTRSLRVDESLTVVIRPIHSESAFVGDGVAFEALVAELAGLGTVHEQAPDATVSTEEPDSPFGYVVWPDGAQGPLAYRGPGDQYLTRDFGWHVLGIHDGASVLDVDASLIAG